MTELDATRRSQATFDRDLDALWSTVAYLPMPIALFSREGVLLRANVGFAELTGCTGATPITYAELTGDPDDGTDPETALLELLLAGRTPTYRLNRLLRRAEGPPRLTYIRTFAPPHVDEDRWWDGDWRPRVVFRAIGDLADREDFEAELRAREAEARTFTDNATEMITRHTPDGRYLYVSPMITDIAGYAAEDVIGRSAYDFFHPDDISRIEDVHRALLDDSVIATVQYRYRCKDGSYTWLETASRAIRDDTGEIVELQTSSRDVTQRVESEERLLTQRRELEQFAYVASHDLSEPLRAIAGFGSLLERELGPDISPKAKEYLGFVLAGVERLQSLIADLLQYSRTGRSDAPVEEVDLADVVAELQPFVVASLQANDVSLTVESLPSVRANRREMTQLLQNLISNAIKYRDTSREDRRVVVGSASIDNGWWEIRVDDNGIGIEPQYREKVFGVFERLHSRADYTGSGIGLAICQKIVNRYGGRIWVEESELGGSSFRFTMPGA